MTTRGAANDAFQALFSLPFGQRVVDGFRLGPGVPEDAPSDVAKRDGGGSRFRSYAGVTLLSAGVIGAAASIYGLESAVALNKGLGDGGTGQAAADVNEKARTRTLVGAIGLGVAGTAAVSGLVLLLWPESHSNVSWDPSVRSASVAVHGSF